MKHLLTIILCVFLLGCGNVQNYPESFKPDDKCYMVVESSFSLNEKFKELLSEALKDRKMETKNQILNTKKIMLVYMKVQESSLTL